MKQNIAVVGCGHWGKNLVRNFSELGSLSAVCDPNTQVAEDFSRKYNADNLSFDDVIRSNKIQGIVLAVPAPLHAEMSILAMKAGKHVYVEKPLAMSKGEADKMIEVSKTEGVQLMVGHLLQYHPIFTAMKNLVDSGGLGEVSYIYSNRLSFGQVRSEEDVIWSFAPHDISMVLSLINEDPEEVLAQSSQILQKNITDSSTIHMKFKNNRNAHIFVSWLHPYKEHKLVVVGKNAMAVFDDSLLWKNKLSLYDHKVNIDNGIPDLSKADVRYIDVEESEPLRNECMHFMEVVNNNTKPKTDSIEGLRVLNVLSAASLSQASKKIIKIKDYA